MVRITAVMLCFEIGAKLINPRLDLKILHDLAIAYLFYQLGTRSTLRSGNGPCGCSWR
ncbi:hypothetical protein RAA17_09465 [Komagataeibacter rhaeticus]|nr:hypothetical protein [Komagataeibacter rhaeticus]